MQELCMLGAGRLPYGGICWGDPTAEGYSRSPPVRHGGAGSVSGTVPQERGTSLQVSGGLRKSPPTYGRQLSPGGKGFPHIPGWSPLPHGLMLHNCNMHNGRERRRFLYAIFRKEAKQRLGKLRSPFYSTFQSAPRPHRQANPARNFSAAHRR